MYTVYTLFHPVKAGMKNMNSDKVLEKTIANPK